MNAGTGRKNASLSQVTWTKISFINTVFALSVYAPPPPPPFVLFFTITKCCLSLNTCWRKIAYRDFLQTRFELCKTRNVLTYSCSFPYKCARVVVFVTDTPMHNCSTTFWWEIVEGWLINNVWIVQWLMSNPWRNRAKGRYSAAQSTLKWTLVILMWRLANVLLVLLLVPV